MRQGVEARSWAIPNDVERVPELRRVIQDFLAEIGTFDDDRFDILVATDEAISNACRHGLRDGDGAIFIRCLLAGRQLVVQVIDDGPGFDPRDVNARRVPDVTAPGGRGLFLMHQLMDRVEIKDGEPGTVVTMTRRLRPTRSLHLAMI